MIVRKYLKLSVVARVQGPRVLVATGWASLLVAISEMTVLSRAIEINLPPPLQPVDGYLM